MNKDPWTTPTAEMMDEFDENKIKYMFVPESHPHVRIMAFSDSHNGKEFWASIVLTEKQIKSQDIRAYCKRRISEAKDRILEYKKNLTQ
jgi:hypothetical protein